MAFSYNQDNQDNPFQSNGSGGGKAKKSFRFSPKLLIIALLVVFVLVAISTGFFVVDQTEQAVILRFGKYLKTVGPGLQFKIPFGIDSSYNVET